MRYPIKNIGIYVGVTVVGFIVVGGIYWQFSNTGSSGTYKTQPKIAESSQNQTSQVVIADKYSGHYVDKDSEDYFIDVHYLGDQTIKVSGSALYGIVSPEGQKPDPNIGSFEGQAKINSDNVSIYSSGDSEDDCKVTMVFEEGGMKVEDNKNCGGMNVSFSGNYIKKATTVAIGSSAVNQTEQATQDASQDQRPADGRVKLFEFENLTYYSRWPEDLMGDGPEYNDVLTAIDQKGNIRFQFKFSSNSVVGSYLVDKENKVLYLGNAHNGDLEGLNSGPSEIYALALETGKQKWLYKTDGANYDFHQFGNFLLFGTEDGTIHCVDKITGVKKWTFRPSQAIESSGRPRWFFSDIVVKNGLVDFSEYDFNYDHQTLFAVDFDSGKVLNSLKLPTWMYFKDDHSDSKSALLFWDKSITVIEKETDKDNAQYVLNNYDNKTLKLKWHKDLGDAQSFDYLDSKDGKGLILIKKDNGGDYLDVETGELILKPSL